ncbi:hypothetical protein AMTRI_Chr05g64310 [Amborella trichopoda]|uniref:Auxin-responsive protein n=1 Tax=Amborella trichopoda TaxID=13333 RepID=W1NMB4_AMBTC|nr:auxin-induced protein 22D [Amborella trichopoda]ERM97022.1 hypothetical protein AMTR_s00122p00019410 [Amborella trichopoda]|eukprot:XP_006829606.1 auxin-induced protein 22D [Amborella trichopoda]
MDLQVTELRLGLPGTEAPGSLMVAKTKKRGFSEISECKRKEENCKNQVVGWPPVRSFRKHVYLQEKMEEQQKKNYVKVGMEGTPYLRKMDLKMFNEYSELSKALAAMFGCFSIGISNAKEERKSSEYFPIYEDDDGDWMLVGDVPWEMFVESCKRLRIVKNDVKIRKFIGN